MSDINDLKYQQEDMLMSKQSMEDMEEEEKDDPITLKIALRYSLFRRRPDPIYLSLILNSIHNIIAVCIYRYVIIIMGLWGKCNVDGHYFIFAAVLANNYVLYDVVTIATLHTAIIFHMQSFNFPCVVQCYLNATYLIRKARDDEASATKRLNDVIANYGDVIPRRDFESLTKTHQDLENKIQLLQEDFQKLKDEHE